MTIQQFLLILRARWWVVAGTLVLVASITLGVSLLLPKSYTASTTIVVDAQSADPIAGVLIPSQLVPGYLATQIDIINSDRVAQKVVKLLKLEQIASVREDWLKDTGGQGAIEVWLADLLQTKLAVTPSRESSVMTVEYSGVDPQFAAAVANAFAQAYMEVNLELKVEPAKQFASWFDERNKQLRADVEAAQTALAEFQQAKGIVASDERLSVENARLAELSSQLVAVQSQRFDSSSRQTQASKGRDVVQEVLQNPLITNLKVDLARKEASLDDLAVRLGKNHPEYRRAESEVVTLRQQVKDETGKVVSSLSSNNAVNRMREAEIRAALEAQKQRVLELKEQNAQLAVLLRDVDNAQRAYDLVTQRLAQTSLESQTQRTNVAVLTPAIAPLEPSSPRVALNVALSIFLGGLLGLGVALLLEMIDPRVRGEEDLQLLEGVPLLGVIPRPVRGKGAIAHSNG